MKSGFVSSLIVRVNLAGAGLCVPVPALFKGDVMARIVDIDKVHLHHLDFLYCPHRRLIERGGVQVALTRQESLIFQAVQAVFPRSVLYEDLAACLWPDGYQGVPRLRLQKVISTLRAALQSLDCGLVAVPRNEGVRLEVYRCGL